MSADKACFLGAEIAKARDWNKPENIKLYTGGLSTRMNTSLAGRGSLQRGF